MPLEDVCPCGMALGRRDRKAESPWCITGMGARVMPTSTCWSPGQVLFLSRAGRRGDTAPGTGLWFSACTVSFGAAGTVTLPTRGSRGGAPLVISLLESGSPDGVTGTGKAMPMGEMLQEPLGGQGPLCPGAVGKSHVGLFLRQQMEGKRLRVTSSPPSEQLMSLWTEAVVGAQGQLLSLEGGPTSRGIGKSALGRGLPACGLCGRAHSVHVPTMPSP